MSARFFRAPLVRAAGAMLVIAPAVFATAEARPQETAPEITARLANTAGQSLGPPGAEVRSLVIAPTNADRMYLGTSLGHLYRSHDRGEVWVETALALGHEAVIDNLLVHPSDADVLFAAYWLPDGTGGLVRTDDGGDSWRELDLLGTPSLRALAMAPGDSRVMYAGGIGGVWRSDDGGESWFNVNGQGLVSDFVESLAVDPRDPDHVYAGTWRQVYRSRNGGSNWERVYSGMALDRDVFSIAISPHDPDLVFAGTCNFLYCSTNAGSSWGERRAGLAVDHNRIHAILHDPRDASVIYAGTRGALYRSNDGGVQWEVFLPGVTVSALALDPDGTLFVGTEERGVLKQTAGGEFAEMNTGLASSRVVAFDTLPGAPRVIFAARSDGPVESSLHYSTDLGATWRRLGRRQGLAGIVGLRAQTAPANRVLVATRQGWWSVAPGGAWGRVPSPPGTTTTFEIAHAAGGQVLAATSDGLFGARSELLVDTDGDARPFDAEDGAWRPLWTDGAVAALAVSGDRMIAWAEGTVLSGAVDGTGLRARPEPVSELPIIGVAMDPTDPSLAYAVSRREVFASRDGGLSWSSLPLPWPAAELRAVAMDPSTPDQVLVLDYRGAIYRGHGGGAHWLVLDDDRGLHRAWEIRTEAQAPGWALVATQGHGLRAVRLSPRALPAGNGGE